MNEARTWNISFIVMNSAYSHIIFFRSCFALRQEHFIVFHLLFFMKKKIIIKYTHFITA